VWCMPCVPCKVYGWVGWCGVRTAGRACRHRRAGWGLVRCLGGPAAATSPACPSPPPHGGEALQALSLVDALSPLAARELAAAATAVLPTSAALWRRRHALCVAAAAAAGGAGGASAADRVVEEAGAVGITLP
jgi:hypothetical protein